MCSVLCTVQCVAGVMICTYLVVFIIKCLAISHCLQRERSRLFEVSIDSRTSVEMILSGEGSSWLD